MARGSMQLRAGSEQGKEEAASPVFSSCPVCWCQRVMGHQANQLKLAQSIKSCTINQTNRISKSGSVIFIIYTYCRKNP